MKTIIILGAQGSGKTTKARELTKDIEDYWQYETTSSFFTDALINGFKTMDLKAFIVEELLDLKDVRFILKMIDSKIDTLILTSQKIKKSELNGIENLEIIEL